MKAIVYDGIQKVECRKVADPKIEKDDDIIIKVTSTAICGSDLHLVHGLVKGMYDGFILGHETMGIIEEVGKDLSFRWIYLKLVICDIDLKWFENGDYIVIDWFVLNWISKKIIDEFLLTSFYLL